MERSKMLLQSPKNVKTMINTEKDMKKGIKHFQRYLLQQKK